MDSIKTMRLRRLLTKAAEFCVKASDPEDTGISSAQVEFVNKDSKKNDGDNEAKLS